MNVVVLGLGMTVAGGCYEGGSDAQAEGSESSGGSGGPSSAGPGSMGPGSQGTSGGSGPQDTDGSSTGEPSGSETDAEPLDPCEPPRAEQPSIALPPEHSNVWVLDLDAWEIDHTGVDPIGTRQKINDALRWAVDNDFDRVRVPAGTYLVGEKTNDIYSDGIQVPGEMTLELDDGAVIQMAPNDTWNYCVVAVTGRNDVTITGGEIRGERDEHVYEGGGAHDEGHGICVQNESERVLIENIEIHEVTGDGVLIVGQGGDGTSCKDVTIRDSNLHHNRRQGVSIVGGERVHIADNEIHHIEGTAPQFGIDIESLAYISDSIVIERNSFHANKGGDYVNTDGTNVWFQDNVLDQGDVVDQIDGPIVHWKNTDQTIRNNTITMHSRTVNGLWGIIGYTSGDDPRTNPAANYIEGNEFFGCGLHMANNSLQHVRDNIINDWMILGSRLSCVRLSGNQVFQPEGETYKFREVAGVATDNEVNGQPAFLPMADNAPFTNSPPHLW